MIRRSENQNSPKWGTLSGPPWAPISVFPASFQKQLGPSSGRPKSPGFTMPLYSYCSTKQIEMINLNSVKLVHKLPHSLTDLQRDYLDFIRQYVCMNKSSPRLEEIAIHFNVKAPTAHKILSALQRKGYLYFGRDSQSGVFIRLIERAGSTEPVMPVLQRP